MHITVSHQRIKLESTFEHFTQTIETVLHRLKPDWPVDTDYLTKTAGDTGLMIFAALDHGKLLSVKGQARKAIQYLIGNPLTAAEMTQCDIRAALYAPLRVLVYEADDQVLYAEYDLPSTLFGQFGNEDILAVSRKLDASILAVILLADQKK